MCRTLDECGAYSLVADDVEWNSHPSNIITITVSGITITTVRPRPVFIKPRIYAATENLTAVIDLFNYRELQWKEWTAASMALHQAMINSIEALNLATIERLSGHAGILSLTCQQLLGHITAMFGSLHATDVFYIENHIKKELTSFTAFRDFISRNSLNYAILTKIPHPISDITKIHWLKNSLQQFPQFDIPIGTWTSLNTNVASRSYQALVQYLSDQPCRPTRLLAEAKLLVHQTARPQPTKDKAVNANVTVAKAAKAPAVVGVTTLKARSNNRHRKRTPSLLLRIPPKNMRNIAPSGKMIRPPWPFNCTNGPTAPRLFPQLDPTPVPSGGLKQPPIVFTAPCTDSTLPTMATCADQCLTTPRRTPSSTSTPRNPATAAIQRATKTCKHCVRASTRGARGAHTTLLPLRHQLRG
jgi:hypothetical protein